MNAMDDRKENPRLESPGEAAAREQAEALERACPVHRCRAAPGALCINVATGRPFRGGVSHIARLRQAGQ